MPVATEHGHGRRLLQLLYAPRAAFSSWLERGLGARSGFSAVLVMGLGWAAFLALLASGGHSPSGPPLLPIAPEDYYAFEALFVVPVYLLMFGGLSLASHGVARGLGGVGSLGQSAGVAGLAMAVPSVLFWLLPDLAVYLTLGFDALPAAMMLYVPVAMLYTLFITLSGIRVVHQLPLGRSLAAAIIGLVVHLAIGGPFLR